MVPTGKLEAVLGVLDDEEIDYAVTDETSRREFIAVVSFPLPEAAVEPILDELRDAGIEEDAYTVVMGAETVISRRFDQLEERYEADEETQDRISREELHSRAEDLAPDMSTFVVMTVISAVVATAGVLIDSPAVVVGSMVIAPLVGPAVSTSVGSVVNDDEMFVHGAKLQAIGVLVAVVAAAIFAFFVRMTGLVPILDASDLVALGQFEGRLTPDFLSLVVALGAGVAGALSVATGVSIALVGVMIAAALVPPIAVVGIGVAWGRPMTVVTAGVLVLVNVLSINLAALVVLWYKGYRPNLWFEETEARRDTLKRIGVLVVAIGVLSVFLAGVTYASYQSAASEKQIQTEIQTLLSNESYSHVSLIEVEFQYSDNLPFRDERRVIVTVGRPTGTSTPKLAEAIYRHINVQNDPLLPFFSPTDESVTVEVRYMETSTVTPPEMPGGNTTNSTAGGTNASNSLVRAASPPPGRPATGHAAV